MKTEPCSACGNKPRIEKHGVREYYCECPICEPDSYLHQSRREAVTKWNQREVFLRRSQRAIERGKYGERMSAYE